MQASEAQTIERVLQREIISRMLQWYFQKLQDENGGIEELFACLKIEIDDAMERSKKVE